MTEDTKQPEYNEELGIEITEELQNIILQLDTKELKYANLLLDPNSDLPEYRAYQEAGYKSKEMAAAAACASRLKKKPLIQRYMKIAREAIARSNLMGVAEVAERIQKQAFADITQIFDWKIVPLGIDGKPVDTDADGNPENPDEVVSETFVPFIKKSAQDLPPEIRQLIKSVTLTKMGPKIELNDQARSQDMYIRMIGGYDDTLKIADANGNPIGSGGFDINLIPGPGLEEKNEK